MVWSSSRQVIVANPEILLQGGMNNKDPEFFFFIVIPPPKKKEPEVKVSQRWGASLSFDDPTSPSGAGDEPDWFKVLVSCQVGASSISAIREGVAWT